MKLADKLFELRKEKAGHKKSWQNKSMSLAKAFPSGSLAKHCLELEKIVELSKIFQVTTDYLLLEDSDKPEIKPVLSEDEKDRYYKQVKSYGFWQVLYIFVSALAIFLFFAGLVFQQNSLPWSGWAFSS